MTGDGKFYACEHKRELKLTRLALAIAALGLLLSGLTTFWLPREVAWLVEAVWRNSPDTFPFLGEEYKMLAKVSAGLRLIYRSYPEILLGTDWLGFAHIALTLLFIGAIKDPVRNKWVIQFGLIAAVMVIPAAFIFGCVRGLPTVHYFIDASFGAGALLPFTLAYYCVKRLEQK